jgi:L-lactate dehydrogenase complex protein LldE
LTHARPTAVYFFGTCLIDLFFPRAGLAGMELLRREGIRVIYPPRQSCCGQPAYNSGYRDEARTVASRQIACFPLDIPVVVPSASCAGMLKHHYPTLFEGHPLKAEADALAARVYELSEFLVDVLAVGFADLGPPVRVAIHTSCSARREMGVGDRVERIVAGLNNVIRVEHDHDAECCGFGGTFAVKQAETSAAMVLDKCDAIRDAGAEVVVSQDSGCLMNIGGALDKAGDRIRPLHIAEFLWERTHGRE